MDEKELELRKLLYLCIQELSYVQEAGAGLSLCASSKGASLVEQGMKLLGIASLGPDYLGGPE